MKLNNLPLNFKLSLAPAAGMVMLAAVTLTALWGFGSLASALDQLYMQQLPSYVFSAQLESKLRDMNGLINQSIALGAVGYGDEDIAKIDKALVKLVEEVRETLKTKLTEIDQRDDDWKDMESIAADFEKYRTNLLQTLQMKTSALVSAATFFGSAQTEYASLLKRISSVSKRQLDQAGGLVAQTRRTADDARRVVLIAAVAAVLLAAGIVVVITRGLLRRVNRLSATARRLAANDLTEPIVQEGNDEIGQLMGDMETVRWQLAGSLRKVRQAAASLRIAAAEIADGSVELGVRTERTSASLQAASSALQKLTSVVESNVVHCNVAAHGSSDAANAAISGGELMSRVTGTMAEISQSSVRMAEVVAVIDRFAQQTNILALNAAVESARAGEHGRGFAVVAGEVRSLATKSREAAREIAGLIAGSNKQIQSGRSLVENAEASVTGLVTRATDVAGVVGEIHAAAISQGSEIAKVNAAVAAADNSTQSNAALAEESGAAAEGLRDQADQLSLAVEQFLLGDEVEQVRLGRA